MKRIGLQILSLVLVLILVAGQSWAKDLQIVCGKGKSDPICEVWAREGINGLPWEAYTNTAWPLLVVPAWRYDILTQKAMEKKTTTGWQWWEVTLLSAGVLIVGTAVGIIISAKIDLTE